jgi:hypothetical protein
MCIWLSFSEGTNISFGRKILVLQYGEIRITILWKREDIRLSKNMHGCLRTVGFNIHGA